MLLAALHGVSAGGGSRYPHIRQTMPLLRSGPLAASRDRPCCCRPPYLVLLLPPPYLVLVFLLQIDPELPENKNPKQSKEDRKMGITREWLPLKNLHHTLAAYEAQGWGVFAGGHLGR